MVVMGGHDDVGVLQFRIASPHDSDHVSNFRRLRLAAQRPVRSLVIAVVSYRLQSAHPKAGSDEVRRDVQPTRGRIATFQQVGGEERQVSPQRIGLDSRDGGLFVWRERRLTLPYGEGQNDGKRKKRYATHGYKIRQPLTDSPAHPLL